MSTPEIQTTLNAVVKLRNTIGDPSGATQTRWSAPELAEYLDRAQMQITLDVPRIFKTQWTCDIVGSQREYSLPVSWISTQSVDFIRSRTGSGTADTDIVPLTNVSYETYRNWLMADEDAEAEPSHYYYWRKLGSTATGHVPPSIFLHPTPRSGDAGTANLRIVGFKMPDDAAADTDKTMELEALFVETAVMYAASIAFMDDDDLARYDRCIARYERGVEDIEGVISRRDFSRVSRLIPKGGRRGSFDGTADSQINWG